MLSSAEGLDTLKQELSSDSTLSAEFSDALMEKINQLASLSSVDNTAEKLTLNGLDKGTKLHEFADLINNRNIGTDFFGKGLPQTKSLEKEIDLENTLDALANVLNTLEQGEQDSLDSQLEGLIARVESIKTVVTEEQSELSVKLDQIVENLERLKQQPVEQLDRVATQLQQLKDLLGENGLSKEAITVADTELDVQLHQLSLEIDNIKDQFFKGTEEQLARPQNDDIDDQFFKFTEEQLGKPQNDGIEDLASETEIASQISALVATLTETKAPEDIAQAAIVKEAKTLPSKDTLSLKQLAAERSIGLTTKAEPEALLQQDNALSKFQKSELDPVLMAKQNGKLNTLELKDVELSSERVLPKFATDIANLNRAMISERKVEVPPMSKHFAHPEWNKEISEKVVWMHKQAIPSAELRLNPGHLGPITIKVDVTQEQATVAFTAQHAAVKEAIDAALPKLREMFSAQQLNLAEVSVSQEDAGQRNPRGFSQMGGDAGKGEKGANDTAENEQAEATMDIVDEIEAGRAIASNGLLSIFA